ncbi:MAG: 3-methyl-2-oxobutanoate hydroxymethyltransferase [Bdellovibrionia bacterium]
MNILDFKKKKSLGEKITVVTCYDYWSARIIADSTIDCILVGDSLAMVMHGHSTTLPATVDIMALHTQAVARGAPKKFIVGDMPFLSFRKGLTENMDAILKIMQAGASAVKLEGADGNEELIRHVVDSGVPVMGHIGLTPQSVFQLGGYRVQGRDEKGRAWLLDQARRLEKAGCFSIVLECVPDTLAAEITRELSIPTIGIGAGKETSGQVLVLHDLLGLFKDLKPKFVRTFLDGHELILGALEDYAKSVKDSSFPSAEETYGNEASAKPAAKLYPGPGPGNA